VLIHSDTLRGRIVSEPRASDSYGGGSGWIQYLALVHRSPGGGSEVWLGGLIRTTDPSATSDPNAFFRAHSPLTAKPGGDVFFLTPTGGSPEYRRLQRIAGAVARGRS